MILIRFIAKLKARQARGGAWVQLILNIGIITANIALFKDWFESFGISLRTMLIAGAGGYILGTMFVGYLDERYGVWKYENEYNSRLNPVTMEMLSTLKDITGNEREKRE